MNYIVLDLEWNQYTNGVNSENSNLPFEIIEIGAVKLNEDFEITDEFQGIIKPVIYPELHYVCQELTGFTSKELQQGKTFSEIFALFLSWCGDEFSFCTWGPSDITELQRNMQFYNIPLFPAPVFFYNIQELFQEFLEHSEQTRSLEYATQFLNIPKSKDFHRAVNDAFYTALVMKAFDKNVLLEHFSIDTYQKPQSYKDEIYVVYDNHSKYVSRVFASKLDAMNDNHVLTTKCYKCNQKLRKKIRWFSENAKNYYSLCYCPIHGPLVGMIKMKKASSDGYFVIKTLKLVSDEEAKLIFERKKEVQKKKRIKRKQNNNY